MSAESEAVSGTDAEFRRLLATVPERDRAALVERRMRAQGASDIAVATGLARLATGGLSTLNAYLEGEYAREMAALREAADVARTDADEGSRTSRAEVDAANRREAIDRRAASELTPRVDPAPSRGVPLAVWFMGAVALLGVAALATRDRWADDVREAKSWR